MPDGVLISSNRTLYLIQSQSPANSRHSLVKMPSFGLPMMIKNIFEESKIASYKIAGNGPRIAIVLGFGANTADASVLPIHHSTPQVAIIGSPKARREETEKGTSSI